MDLPVVTIGVLNYNRKDELNETLNQIQRSDYPNKEIIVVDNGSSDGSVQMVQNHHPEVKLIALEENQGTRSRNEFLFKATGKYVFQYDDDSMPEDEQTIRKIVNFLEENSDVDALCTRIVNYYTKEAETRSWEKFAVAGDEETGYEGLFVHASGMVFRTKSIQNIEGYSKLFFWGMVEADLTFQLLENDNKIVYKPDLVTIHRKSNINRDDKRAFKLRVRNGIFLFAKYLPTPNMLAFTIRYLLRRFITVIRHPYYLTAYFTGIFLGIKGIAQIRDKRRFLNAEKIEKTRMWQKQNFSIKYAFDRFLAN